MMYWLLAILIVGVLAVALTGYTMGVGTMWWYTGRYCEERRRQRRMMRGLCKPWTGRMVLVVVLVLTATALWLIALPALADAQYIVTASDYCNVREQPDQASTDTGNLYAGDIVTGTGYQAGWVQVIASVEAGTGWVRADLLTLADHPTGKHTNTSNGRVRIRREPDGKAIGWLNADGNVDVLRWVDVDGTVWAHTARGYIKSDYLEAE